MGAFMAGQYRFAKVNRNIPIDYSDIESIYSSVIPMDLYHNNNVEGTDKSTAEFMQKIQSSAGLSTFTLNGLNWDARAENQTYVQYKQ